VSGEPLVQARILVVDDDESIRQFISMALADRGYDVIQAEHGQAALECIKVVTPDLILLDMRMPVMDGWAFAKAYRETPPPHAPIVVVTAARDAAQYAAQIAADAFLAKPFDLKSLRQVVADYLARSGVRV
jgi:two-component system, chemotaxis family, chemotaxis protein CheY